jgi:hypothetical protein
MRAIKSDILLKESFRMALFFPPYNFKTQHMPNSQNRSKDQSNIVKPKRKTSKAAAPSQEPVGNKQGGSQVRHANSDASSNEESNKATGNNLND